MFHYYNYWDTIKLDMQSDWNIKGIESIQLKYNSKNNNKNWNK